VRDRFHQGVDIDFPNSKRLSWLVALIHQPPLTSPLVAPNLHGGKKIEFTPSESQRFKVVQSRE